MYNIFKENTIFWQNIDIPRLICGDSKLVVFDKVDEIIATQEYKSRRANCTCSIFGRVNTAIVWQQYFILLLLWEKDIF